VPAPERPRAPAALRLLAEGEVELRGRLPWSSNYTFLADVCLDGVTLPAVYKPERGERGLWDFPPGLHRREEAAYLLSNALGWGLVPETVVRDGPLGVGSFQRFVPSDFAQHYFTLLEVPGRREALRTICAFDLVANNADRKSGHCLLGEDGRIWAIDHGLCFHAHPKLRTVIWEFGGEAVPEHLLADLDALARSVPEPLAALLEADERRALASRAARLVSRPVFPDVAASARPYPWPPI